MSINGTIVVEKTFNDCCTWVIDNFCSYELHEHMYISPQFRTGMYNENVWRLKVLHVYSDRNLLIHLKDCSQKEVEISFRVTILYNDNIRIQKNEDPLTLRKGIEKSISISLELEPLQTCCSINPRGKLTILCEIIDTTRNIINKRNNCLSDDLKLLMHDEEFSDVTLSVEGKQFFVHKSILIARSPVFRAMFENNMKESIENQIEIEDISYEVMQEVLRFIYTDDVENIENLASSILAAAEKYELEHLKTMCLEVLCQNLRNDNALETLILTDLYRADHWKNVTFDYIVSHLKYLDINNLSSHPHLFKEILMYCQINDKPLMS